MRLFIIYFTAVHLYCPMFKGRKCGCLQNYIESCGKLIFYVVSTCVSCSETGMTLILVFSSFKNWLNSRDWSRGCRGGLRLLGGLRPPLKHINDKNRKDWVNFWPESPLEIEKIGDSRGQEKVGLLFPKVLFCLWLGTCNETLISPFNRQIIMLIFMSY